MVKSRFPTLLFASITGTILFYIKKIEIVFTRKVLGYYRHVKNLAYLAKNSI